MGIPVFFSFRSVFLNSGKTSTAHREIVFTNDIFVVFYCLEDLRRNRFFPFSVIFLIWFIKKLLS